MSAAGETELRTRRGSSEPGKRSGREEEEEEEEEEAEEAGAGRSGREVRVWRENWERGTLLAPAAPPLPRPRRGRASLKTPPTSTNERPDTKTQGTIYLCVEEPNYMCMYVNVHVHVHVGDCSLPVAAQCKQIIHVASCLQLHRYTIKLLLQQTLLAAYPFVDHTLFNASLYMLA